MIHSPSHAIELLGGSRSVSAFAGRPITTVASWAARESIPVDAWPKLIDMALTRNVEGLNYETLTHLHANKAPKAPRRAA